MNGNYLKCDSPFCLLQGSTGAPGLPGVTGRTGAPVRSLPFMWPNIIHNLLCYFIPPSNVFMVTYLFDHKRCHGMLKTGFSVRMLFCLQGLMGRPGPMGQPGAKGEKVRCSFIYVGSVYVFLDIVNSTVGSE